VRQHECWNTIRRFVSPPPFPGVIRPRATHRSKHVPAKNPGADVLHASLRPFIIDTSRSAFVAVHLLPRARREEPLEQFWPTNAKRIFETLVRPSSVAIQRYRKRVHTDFGHHSNLQNDDAHGQTSNICFGGGFGNPRHHAVVTKFQSKVRTNLLERSPLPGSGNRLGEGAWPPYFMWSSGNCVVSVTFHTGLEHDQFLRRYLEKYPSSVE
jgi:hypothetical protein